MSVLLDNMSMIGLNSFLALIPLLFGWLMVKTRQKFFQLSFVLLWFFFLPNTLYTVTDLQYLPEQWHSVHCKTSNISHVHVTFSTPPRYSY